MTRAALIVLMTTLVAAADPLPQVPVLIIDAPPTFDLGRFATALETYVPNVQIATVPHAAAPDEVVCADALAQARAIASPIGLWVRWVDGAMVIAMVPEAGCGAVESSTVEVPADQPTFVYRVAALKLGSMLRGLPVVPPPVAPPPVVIVPSVPVTPPPAALDRSIEIGATGIASTSAADRVYLASAGAWIGRAWSIGASFSISASRDAESAAGAGTARLFGVLGGVRRTLTHGERWALDLEAGVGVVAVWSSADRSDGQPAMSDHAITPIASLAPRLRLAVAGPIGLSLGPTLDVAPRSVRFSLGDTPLYHAGMARLRWDVRAQIWF